MAEKLSFFLLFYPILLFSLSFHETAHAWMADKFGDPTARLMGRVSLNPLRHIDFVGTFLMPVIAMFSGLPLIGWAKPVPVNSLNLKSPRRDTLWISASGPFMNFLLACVFAALNWVLVLGLPHIESYLVPGSFFTSVVSASYSVTNMGVILNLALAIFNLIPIHPLDGGGVIRGLLPENMVDKFDSFARYGMFILLALLFTGALRFIFWPVQLLAKIMLPAI